MSENKYEHFAEISRKSVAKDFKKVFKKISCTNKKRYSCKKRAAKLRHVKVYKCKFCGGWHRSEQVFRFAKRFAKKFGK